MPETFSSDIGNVHERGPRREGTFTSEFRGLSDSMIEQQRPAAITPRSGGLGKVIAAVVLSLVLIGGMAVGGYFVFATFGPRLLAWMEGEAEVAEAPTEAAVAEQATGVQEPTGASEPPPAEPVATPSETPPPTPPPPAPVTGSVTSEGTSVRGRVSTASVDARLADVDAALQKCWADAVTKGARGPKTVTLKFKIRWNRKATGVAASGDSLPSGIEDCIEDALPRSGWPEPRDLGEATVSRTWKLLSQ